MANITIDPKQLAKQFIEDQAAFASDFDDTLVREGETLNQSLTTVIETLQNTVGFCIVTGQDKQGLSARAPHLDLEAIPHSLSQGYDIFLPDGRHFGGEQHSELIALHGDMRALKTLHPGSQLQFRQPSGMVTIVYPEAHDAGTKQTIDNAVMAIVEKYDGIGYYPQGVGGDTYLEAYTKARALLIFKEKMSGKFRGKIWAAGNALNDKSMLDAAKATGGKTIGIGPFSPNADYKFATVELFNTFLVEANSLSKGA